MKISATTMARIGDPRELYSKARLGGLVFYEGIPLKKGCGKYDRNGIELGLIPLGVHPPVRLTSRHSAPYLIYLPSLPQQPEMPHNSWARDKPVEGSSYRMKSDCWVVKMRGFCARVRNLCQREHIAEQEPIWCLGNLGRQASRRAWPQQSTGNFAKLY
jgi:hypothetical protein